MTVEHDDDRWPVVEFLLCAADLARQGYPAALSAAIERCGNVRNAATAVFEARAVAPRIFEYRNDLLADSLLEAAYRVAEGRGVS